MQRICRDNCSYNPYMLQQKMEEKIKKLERELSSFKEKIASGELVEMPFQLGEIVHPTGYPDDKQSVDSITFYKDGRVTIGFHELGMRQTFVDEWSEGDPENFTTGEDEDE